MLTTPYLANSAKTKSMRLQGELSASINSAIFSVRVSIEIYMGDGQQRKGYRDSFCSFRPTASFRGSMLTPPVTGVNPAALTDPLLCFTQDNPSRTGIKSDCLQ